MISKGAYNAAVQSEMKQLHESSRGVYSFLYVHMGRGGGPRARAHTRSRGGEGTARTASIVQPPAYHSIHDYARLRWIHLHVSPDSPMGREDGLQLQEWHTEREAARER